MRICRWTLALLLLSTLLYGCTDAGTVPGSSPVKASAVYNDMFRITCSSPKYEYDSGQMQKEAPLCFELKIEYIGDEPSITIWHGDPIGGVELMNQDGTSMLPFAAGDSRSASELEKGKEYSIEVFTGAVEYELFGGFSPGNYIAEASVAFKFGENAAEELVCVLDLPFAVT